MPAPIGLFTYFSPPPPRVVSKQDQKGSGRRGYIQSSPPSDQVGSGSASRWRMSFPPVFCLCRKDFLSQCLPYEGVLWQPIHWSMEELRAFWDKLRQASLHPAIFTGYVQESWSANTRSGFDPPSGLPEMYPGQLHRLKEGLLFTLSMER